MYKYERYNPDTPSPSSDFRFAGSKSSVHVGLRYCWLSSSAFGICGLPGPLIPGLVGRGFPLNSGPSLYFPEFAVMNLN